jgi:serpin B
MSLSAILLCAGGLVVANHGVTSRNRPKAITYAPVSHLEANLGRVRVAGGSTDVRLVARSEQSFSLALLAKMAEQQPGANVVISPTSVATVLAMLDLGARGSTAAAIAKVLQSTRLNAQQLATGWNGLSAELHGDSVSDGVTLEQANGLWIQLGIHVRQSYISELARAFGSGVWQTDFSDDPAAAADSINRWVSKSTDGQIPALFTPEEISAVRVLIANAVYFHGSWQTPFDAGLTVPARFYLSSGATERVPTMTLSGATLMSGANHGVLSVELPYTGKSFVATILEPYGVSMTAFLQSLTRSHLDAILSGLQASPVQTLTMPRFQVAQQTDLIPLLGALGMAPALAPAADFSGIAAVLSSIGIFKQAATIRVNEQGTMAAAATGGGIVEDKRTPVVIKIDHPFVFMVRNVETGTILFESVVSNP